VSRVRGQGIPDELPVMASLVESGLQNLNGGDRDAVGFFQMRVGIWNSGPYAGFPDDPELQLTWFVDQALAVKRQRIAAGDAEFGADPAKFGEWIADVERPAEQFRGRYQLRLDQARTLIGQACTNQPDPDTDDDGIPNEIDVVGTALPTFSDSMPPAATTGNRGVITATNGLAVKIQDLPAPDGVRITTTGAGGPATIAPCGLAMTISFGAGAFDMACGSVTIKVGSDGPVKVISGPMTISIPNGVTATLDRTGPSAPTTVAGISGGQVNITIGSVTVPVAAGTPATTFPVTITSLCKLTTDSVKGSAKYTTLTTKQKAAVDALSKAACNILTSITPKLNAKQKSTLITAYKATVQALVQPGWLSQLQADTLKNLANTL
jgi:hypothetical protein